MNTANLQLEGFYLVIAALNELLIARGVITRQDVDDALQKAEEAALNGYAIADMSGAHRDAVAFAPRLLQLASRGTGDGQIQSFAELAKLVGKTKNPKD
jgi:hypothetical protein